MWASVFISFETYSGLTGFVLGADVGFLSPQPFLSYCSSGHCCSFLPSLSSNHCRRGPGAADISINAELLWVQLPEAGIPPACVLVFLAQDICSSTPGSRHACSMLVWALWGQYRLETSLQCTWLVLAFLSSVKEGKLHPTKLWSNIWHMACA